MAITKERPWVEYLYAFVFFFVGLVAIWWAGRMVPSYVTLLLMLGWVILLLLQTLFIRRACCRPRIQLGSTEEEVFARIATLAPGSAEESQEKTFKDKIKKLKKTISIDGIREKWNKMYEMIEFKTDAETGKNYLEEKFPSVNESPFSRNVKSLFQALIDNRSAWGIFLLIIIICTSIWNPDWESSTSDAVSTYLAAFAALFSVLISLLFSNGIEKNKENKRLFQALCGDIKALAMYACALTNDINKYDIQHEGNNNNLPIESIKKRGSVEIEFAKLRYLLAVLAPVAKHVLRQAPNPNNACYKKLDDKYRIRVYVSRGTVEHFCIKSTFCKWRLRKYLCCGKRVEIFKGFRCFAPRVEFDTSQVWGKMGGEDGNALKYYLFKKIKYLVENTKMDLFEVVMYCILDQINDMRERSSLNREEIDARFIKNPELRKRYDIIDSYGKERDLIAKYQHIYGSWGTMYSLTTYDQPGVVHITIVLSLLLYTYGLTAYNINEARVNWAGSNPDPDAPDWSREEDITDLYIVVYVILKSLLQIIPFTWFWFLSRSIGKPFKKGYPDATIISKDARDTQEQVSRLMSVRAKVDACDQLNFDISEAKMKEAINRSSIAGDNILYNKGWIENLKEKDRKLQQRTQQEYKKGLRMSGSKQRRASLRVADVNEERRLRKEAREKVRKQMEEEKLAKAGAEKEADEVNNYQPKTFKVRFKNVNF